MSEQAFKTLLILDLDGDVFGFTDGQGLQLETSVTGIPRSIQFVPGLISISLPSRTIDPIANSVSDGSSSIRVSLKEVPALKALMSGANLYRASGRIYCWQGERVVEDAVLGYSGTLRSPRLDPSAGEFEFVLEVIRNAVNRPFPATVIGDEGRFVDPATNSIDEPMPVVYGRVKKMAIPTLFLDNDAGKVTMCLASHPVVGDPANEGYVRVGTDEDGDGTTAHKIHTAVDGLGANYSYIIIDYSVWNDSIYVVDMIGKKRAGRSGGITKLGEVLDDIWSVSSSMTMANLDAERASIANERLNGYDVSLAINEVSEDQTLLDILTGRISGQFPVVFGSPNGLYGWDCVDLPGSRTPPISRLIYGQNAFDRESLEMGDPGSVINRFSMSFGINGQTEQNEESIALGADTSELCRHSQSIFGPSTKEAITASDVGSAVTAARILRSRSHRLAIPRISVSYSAISPEFIHFPLMSVIEVTDSDLLWEKKRFALTEVRPLPDIGRVLVTLLSMDPVAY